jgi:hypothetical protein
MAGEGSATKAMNRIRACHIFESQLFISPRTGLADEILFTIALAVEDKALLPGIISSSLNPVMKCVVGPVGSPAHCGWVNQRDRSHAAFTKISIDDNFPCSPSAV